MKSSNPGGSWSVGRGKGAVVLEGGLTAGSQFVLPLKGSSAAGPFQTSDSRYIELFVVQKQPSHLHMLGPLPGPPVPAATLSLAYLPGNLLLKLQVTSSFEMSLADLGILLYLPCTQGTPSSWPLL